MMSSQEIFALRKQGKIQDALGKARAMYAENSQDIWFLRAYTWALFDHVKLYVESYAQKELSPTAMSRKVSDHMREFCKFGKSLKQDPAFSQMVRLAVKASKDWKDFLAFAKWAGIDCFSEEDKKPFATEDGKEVASLEKRFIRAVCRETVTKATDLMAEAKATEWGESVLDNALVQDPNDQLLNYYRSKLHLLRNENGDAIKRLLPVIHRQSRVSWTWSLLGAIMEPMRSEDAITCYAHATKLARQEQEVAKTRIHLARLLAAAGRFSEAGWETWKAIEYREQNGFRLPPELVQLSESDWYQKGLQTNFFQAAPDVAFSAKTLLLELDRQNLAYRLGVVDHVNVNKQLTFVATSVDNGYVLMHRKFPDIAGLQPGSLVEVGFNKQDESPLDWRLTSATQIPGLCEFLEGELDHHEGKAFAFIRTVKGDIFVSPEFLQLLSSQSTGSIRCQAICHTHKKTGKASWRALRLMERHEANEFPDSTIL